MSIFHHCGSGFPVKEKGYTAEEYTFPVRICLGCMENILRTVTIMWSAIIRALGLFLPFCRECWSFSEIRGFLFEKTI